MNLPLLDADRAAAGPPDTCGRPAPAMGAADAAVLAGLRQDGVHVTSLAALDLPGSVAMMTAALAMTDDLATGRAAASARGSSTLTAGAAAMLRNPAVLHWGLDARVLAIVEAYLGRAVGYDAYCHFYSIADGKECDARVWHRDREDRRMVKICCYVTDVDADAGPLEVLRAEHHPALRGLMRWRYSVIRDAHLHQSLRGRMPAEDPARTLVGQRGTVIFFDPGRFYHRGVPPRLRDRSAIFHSYFPRLPRHPFCCERSPLSRAQIRSLARDLPAAERDCLLWRDGVPAPMRWIPPNRLKV